MVHAYSWLVIFIVDHTDQMGYWHWLMVMVAIGSTGDSSLQREMLGVQRPVECTLQHHQMRRDDGETHEFVPDKSGSHSAP